MIAHSLPSLVGSPALVRLRSLAPLDPVASKALETAMLRARAIRPRRELLGEGTPIKDTLLLLDGWAARIRQLADGRRQILNFILPGDLIGICDHQQPVASSTVVSVTAVSVCSAPERGVSATLDEAYAVSRALEEAHLFAQIVRLGRLNAHERITDLFLELLERLELAGLATNGRFAMPLTQELVADALGLTSVHVNRVLQQARRTKELSWSGRELTLHQAEALRHSIGRQQVRVTRQ